MSGLIDPSILRGALRDAARHYRRKLDSSATKRMAKYRDDPVGFARHEMGIEPWSRQADILRAAVEHNRVLCRAGQKLGKSLAAVILALWFVATRPAGRVLMTAPSSDQVKKVLWRELRLHYPRVRVKLDGDRDVVPLSPATGLEFSGGRQIFGRTARSTESMAGFSGPELLFILDECSGIDDEIYEACKGNAAGGAIIVGFSNPTRVAGWFYEGFRNGIWHTIHISSEESPNVLFGPDGQPVASEGEPIPGLALPDWIAELRRECGRNYMQHPMYQVRVLGVFPSAGPNAIYGLDAVEAARKRWNEFVEANVKRGESEGHGASGTLSLGIDPKRFGNDDAVIFPRRGDFYFRPRVLDGPQTGDAIAAEAISAVGELRHPRLDSGAVPIKVDGRGVGAATVDALRRSDEHRNGEIVVIDVDVSERADDPTRYHDMRTQLWFAGNEAVEEGAMLPPSPELTQELLCANYRFDGKGRFLAQGKDEMRAALTPKRSPNHADAFCLASYEAAGGVVDGVLTAAALDEDDDEQRGVY